ncbi:DUF4880 domain-containing protein [Alcanivorax sp. IO_7]|nr:DUF4880 domain-containing protein [Alcanivorax sp. IO_7]
MTANAALGRHAARHGLEPGRLEAALEWQVTLWSGEMDDAGHRDWAAWLAAHPGNQRAWAEVERLAGRLGELPSDVARHSLKRSRRFSRRQALTLFGLAGAGALVARGGWVERAVADCRSGPGEQRDLTLPDGSSLKLNTASAVNLAFNGERRLRVLPGSEIALDSRGTGAARCGWRWRKWLWMPPTARWCCATTASGWRCRCWRAGCGYCPGPGPSRLKRLQPRWVAHPGQPPCWPAKRPGCRRTGCGECRWTGPPPWTGPGA